jgi:ABC-type multidrug transport system fused ATPase/permease subunit
MNHEPLKNIAVLIPRNLQRKGILITLLLIVSALFDLISVASFFPLIFVIVKPSAIDSYSYLSSLYTLSGLSDPKSFAMLLTGSALLIISIKTLVNNFITLKKANYAYQIATDLASHALSNYFNSPYAHFVNLDYTQEMNRISNLPLTFANNLIIPLGTVLSESFLALLLLTGIAIYDPRVFSILFILILPIILFYRLKRQGIKNMSEQIKITYPLVLKYTLQSIESFPEIKMFQKENYFKQRFNNTYQKLSNILSADHTLTSGTSRTTELIGAFCIGLIIFYTMLAGKSGEETVLLLSIYAGVSFRLIPSINKIFSALVQIRTHEYVTEELNQMLKPLGVYTHGSSSIKFKDKLEINNISFGHEKNKLLLNNASLTIHKNEKIILTGKSGIGKTTLLLILMRFIKEQSGTITLDGNLIDEKETSSIRNLIGYVSQNPYILDASIAENIAFGIPSQEIDVSKIKQLILDLDLQDWINSLPKKSDTIIGEKGTKISGGQRQRLAIARALYHDAEILLLDEITNQLDKQSQLEVMNTLKHSSAKNKTIVLISHNPQVWKEFDCIYELREGKFHKMKPEMV